MEKRYKLKGLFSCLGITGFFLFGRYVIARLISKRQGKKLRWDLPLDSCYIKCPSGNLLYAEFDGIINGPPIIFIHGINANHLQWVYQREYFKNNNRLIFLDLPFEIENSSDSQLSIPILASDLNSILNQLNIKNAIIYGHSFGGTVLMEYCSRYLPNGNVKAIVLHGTPYKNPVLTNRFSTVLKYLQEPVLIPYLKFLKRHRKIFNFLSLLNFLNGISVLFFRYLYFSGTQTANQLLYTAAMAPQNDTGAFAEGILQLIKYNGSNKLKDIKIPVLVIGGKKDRLNTVASTNFMFQHLPVSQILILEEGHQSLVENHKLINKELSRFIKSL